MVSDQVIFAFLQNEEFMELTIPQLDESARCQIYAGATVRLLSGSLRPDCPDDYRKIVDVHFSSELYTLMMPGSLVQSTQPMEIRASWSKGRASIWQRICRRDRAQGGKRSISPWVKVLSYGANGEGMLVVIAQRKWTPNFVDIWMANGRQNVSSHRNFSGEYWQSVQELAAHRRVGEGIVTEIDQINEAKLSEPFLHVSRYYI